MYAFSSICATGGCSLFYLKMAVETAGANYGWGTMWTNWMSLNHHYAVLASLSHILNLNTILRQLPQLSQICMQSGKDHEENSLLFKVFHAFDKYLLTAYYVPITILGLEIEQWIKETEVLPYCSLHSGGVYLSSVHLVKDTTMVVNTWACSSHLFIFESFLRFNILWCKMKKLKWGTLEGSITKQYVYIYQICKNRLFLADIIALS